MKLHTTRETLLAPLTKIIGAIEKRQTLPILSNVLIRLAGERLELTATDLEIQLVAVATVAPGEDGQITVPARKLLDIVRLLPERGELRLDLQNERLTVRCGSSRYQLATMPPENFPAFDRGQATTHLALPADLFWQAIDATHYAMAIQDVRYYLNGLLLYLDAQTLRTVASDGHRLAIWSAAIDAGPDAPRQMILPRKAVGELGGLLKSHSEPVGLALSDNSITVDLGPLIFSTRLIEGRYPDFQRVMPGQLDRAYTVNRAELAQALQRVKIMSENKTHAMALAVADDLMTLTTTTPDDEAEESLPATLDGPGMEAGFNAGYLLDALAPISGDIVRLQFNDRLNSCLIDEPDTTGYQAVVMPMRL